MNLQKSLEELEGVSIGDPGFDSDLVQRCHELWSVPLRELSTEDLRLLIGQQIGLEHLIPIAIEALDLNPLEEGEMFPGALLLNVIGAKRSFWLMNPSLENVVETIARKAIRLLADEDRSLCEEIESTLRTMKAEFY